MDSGGDLIYSPHNFVYRTFMLIAFHLTRADQILHTDWEVYFFTINLVFIRGISK